MDGEAGSNWSQHITARQCRGLVARARAPAPHDELYVGTKQLAQEDQVPAYLRHLLG